MRMLNVQADLRERLSEALDPVTVRTSVPADRPEELAVVAWEGGGARLNRLLDEVGIGVSCWAGTEQRAFEIASLVDEAMASLPFAGGYALVEREAMYSDFDLKVRSPRWYLSYTLRTFEPSTQQ